MRVLFVAALVANLLFELMAAVLLITGPQGAFSDFRPADGMWAMNYGFAALAIASAIVWIWPNRNDPSAVAPLLGLLVTFHVCLCIALAIPGNQMGGMIIHGLLAAVFALLFLRRDAWCGTPAP